MIFRWLAPICFLILASCQVYNSESSDDITYFPGGATEGAARSVLSKRCSSCHTFAQDTVAKLIAGGEIVVGQPDNSNLIMRLRGADLGGNENMPPSSALTLDEIASLRAWISSLVAQ